MWAKLNIVMYYALLALTGIGLLGNKTMVANDGLRVCNCKKALTGDSIAKRIESHQHDILRQDSEYAYCPVISKKGNNFAIIQFWTGGSHTRKDNFLLYDTGKMIFVMSSDFEKMRSFLVQGGFKNKDIEQTLSRIKKCIAVNDKVTDSF